MHETRLEKAKTVLRVTSGNFLEMYDFFLFGIYARQIGQTFFPSDDPYASLMATFLSFAAGFAMRPIGASCPALDRWHGLAVLEECRQAHLQDAADHGDEHLHQCQRR